MAIRLKDSQKKALLEGYRLGKTSTALAIEYGCSQNTVIRTVKGMIPPEEYTALKASRSRGDSSVNLEVANESISTTNQKKLDESQSLQLDREKDLDLEAAGNSFDDSSNEIFTEIAPLGKEVDFDKPKELVCEKLDSGVLPSSVYMLVDRSVELDIRPLSDFPELGFIPEEDVDRKVLYLFPNQRSAKRNCARNQRVIKVPDTSVFDISAPFLLEKGITRLIIDGILISLEDD